MEKINVYKIKKNSKIIWRGKKFPCVVGEGGVVRGKKEGDKSTPIGRFPIRRVLYRADKLKLPPLQIPIRKLKPNDGWCIDSNNPAYNKLVKLPCDGKCKKLWRDDGLYDIAVVLGFNDDPPVPGLGSAFFLHIAEKEFSPTDTSIALKKEYLIKILKAASQKTEVCVNDRLNTKILFLDSYMKTIENSVGSKIFKNLPVETGGKKKDILQNGKYSCAMLVSGILLLFGLIKEKHATVSGLLRDMEKFGWIKISKKKRGSILRWEPQKRNGKANEHVGFYVGNYKAISNSRIKKVPQKHHWTYGKNKSGPKRKVNEIYWHPKLEQKYFSKN